jgi:hypothetical protein
MTLTLEPYVEQLSHWPVAGRHILAQYDAETVVVYQAYRPEIGQHAAKHGKLGGGGFSFSRMTWIKPNFLWMMYRSGWGTKESQEVTLAIRVKRPAFEAILREAVPSSFVPALYASEAEWKLAVESSSTRLQWDPDHDPSGAPQERRAVQLGIRGDTLRRFADEHTVAIEDVSELVTTQRGRARSELMLPRERVYPLPEDLAARIGAERT